MIKVAELGGRRLEEMQVGKQYLSSVVSKILKIRGKEFLLRVTEWNQDRMHQSRGTESFLKEKQWISKKGKINYPFQTSLDGLNGLYMCVAVVITKKDLINFRGRGGRGRGCRRKGVVERMKTQ